MRSFKLFLTLFVFIYSITCEKNHTVINNDLDNQNISTFLDWTTFWTNGSDIQDFYIVGFKFYYRPFGPQGIYCYDLESNLNSFILGKESGNYLAVSDSFLFFDVATSEIYRYNFLTDTIDLKFNLPDKLNTSIWGMEISNSYLWAILGSYGDDYYISKFDFSGSLIDSLTYTQKQLLYLTLDEDTIISIDYQGLQLSRYNYVDQYFLSSKPLPCSEIEGIRVFEEKFLFTDLEMNRISAIPLSELE